jgi:hypothetical protein
VGRKHRIKRELFLLVNHEGVLEVNKPISEKEKLVTMLTDIYDQLEELESVLEATFSDLRTNLNKNEFNKITIPKQRLTVIENELFSADTIQNYNEGIFDSNRCQASRSLKLEMGF